MNVRRINRDNRTPNSNKGTTPLDLLEKKLQRLEARKQTKENLNK